MRAATPPWDHLGEAREAAGSLGEPVDLGLARMAFGPADVGFWTVAVYLELDEPEPGAGSPRTVKVGDRDSVD